MKRAAIILLIIGAGFTAWYLLRRPKEHLEELAPETRPVIPE